MAVGAAYVFSGSATGFSSDRVQKLSAPEGPDYLGFPYPVSSAGDLDRDGHQDFVLAANEDDEFRGVVYVHYGSTDGVDLDRVQELTASSPAYRGYFGLSFSGPLDLDADGYGDLAVGAHGTGSQGAVFVYQGGPVGLDRATEQMLVPTDLGDGPYYGLPVAAGGDLDGDGFDDLVVGSDDDVQGTYAGAAFVYFGSVTGVDQTSEEKILPSDGAGWQFFGGTIDGGADIDGDGYDDVVIGAPGDNSWDQASGSIYLYGHCSDGDADGVCSYSDCDDTDPGTAGGSTWYRDRDGDGYGDPDWTIVDCDQPRRTYVSGDGDCDDNDAAIHRGATEVCDGLDNDCDGTVDNDEALDAPTWYADADGDGYGDANASRIACGQPEGTVAYGTDCDDTDPSVYPGADEIAGDGIDQDCDGSDLLGPSDTGEDGEGEGCGGCTSTSDPGSPAWLLVLFGVMVSRRRPRD